MKFALMVTIDVENEGDMPEPIADLVRVMQVYLPKSVEPSIKAWCFMAGAAEHMADQAEYVCEIPPEVPPPAGVEVL